MKRLCVFCGSNKGRGSEYAIATKKMGKMLAARSIGLVYGGGHVGLMGVIADAVLDAGGEAIGVIPRAMVDKELAMDGLTQMHVVDTMHQRKALMAELSDGFAALPGASGTADEFFEIMTWAQLGLHSKPIGMLNVSGYFDLLLRWLDQTVAEGFLKARHRQLVLDAPEPDKLLERLQSYKPRKNVGKWINERDL